MSLKAKLAAIAAALLLVQPAFAVVVIQPIGITANTLGTSQGNDGNLINQSGLTPQYVSGMTGYADYLAQSPTHANASVSNVWVSANGHTSGVIDFDLGGIFSLQHFALWNGIGARGMDSFTLFIDDDASFSSADNLGTWNAVQVSANSPPENFDFRETTGSYVRLQVNSNLNGSPFVTLAEVAFGGSMSSIVVPEPASAALLGIALVAFGFRRNRIYGIRERVT